MRLFLTLLLVFCSFMSFSQEKGGINCLSFDVDVFSFSHNSYTLSDETIIELNKLIKILKEVSVKVEIGAHASCNEDNPLKLSRKRSTKIINYLKNKGISRDRLKLSYYGDEILVELCDCQDPTYKECSEEQHANNRRAEFRVIP